MFEAAELGERLGYAADTAVAVEMLAWQSAARGLHDDARRALEQARALTDRAGTTSVHAHQAITAAFCALCRGDLTETAALLEARITADGGIGSMGEPLGVAPDLVEAYVGLGRTTDAADLAERYAAVTPKPAPPPTAARTRLLYGARLRRAGQRVAAGVTARPRRPLASEPLTSQETRVALLVARGLPNREIAAALFLSPRTVEHHLASVFRKRGFRSRTEVAAAFATADPAQK